MPSIEYIEDMRLQSTKSNSMEIQRNGSASRSREEEINVTENQLAIDIHQENLKKLSKMSEKEILEEKRVLENTLDPKLIEFFKNKSTKLGKKSIGQSNAADCNVSIASEAAMDTEISNNKEIKLETREKPESGHRTRPGRFSGD